MISAAEKITQTIKNIPDDVIFGNGKLAIGREEFVSAAEAMERLQKKGLVSRIWNDHFRPKTT